MDVAVRIAPRAEGDQTAHLLAPSPHAVVASPEYFERRGVPATPDALRGHDCVLYSSLPTPSLWRFRRGRSIRVAGRLSVNHGETLRRAVLDGAGIAYMPRFIVGEDLADGRLVSVLDDDAWSAQRIFLVHPRGRNPAPSARLRELVLAGSRAPWQGGASLQPSRSNHETVCTSGRAGCRRRRGTARRARADSSRSQLT